jgi:hypothetical protein
MMVDAVAQVVPIARRCRVMNGPLLGLSVVGQESLLLPSQLIARTSPTLLPNLDILVLQNSFSPSVDRGLDT